MLPFSPLTNHHSDFKPFFCATAVFWEQLQRELDVVPDLVMSGALQHIDHLHVDWTRFCFESLSCIQNLFKKRILSNCFKSWSHLPPRDDWTNIPLVNDLSRAMETLSTLGKDRGLVRTTEVTYDLIPTSLLTAIRGWKKFWNIYCGVLAASSPLQALTMTLE